MRIKKKKIKRQQQCSFYSFLSRLKGRRKMMMISTVAIYLFLYFNNIQLGISQQTDFSCAIRPTQADTTDKLQRLRAQLVNTNLFAYVIFSEDEHNSEYVQLYDERRAWITGFLGSAGTAVVTRTNAAVWTDGRYWTQAEGELDCKNWYLMRSGQSGVPSLSSWLSSQVNGTPPYNRVGVAAQFVSSNWWSSVSSILSAKNVSLVEVVELIDLIWQPPERPPASFNSVFVHELQYTGINWEEKVRTISGLIKAKKANAFIVTTLDEVAWLFSIRGSDIPYNPFFKV
jgi:Xaa-Pro aminopeptidase